MDEVSNDQLIAVFGKGFEDLKLQSVQQTKILQNVEKILDKRVSIEDNRYAITAEAQAKRDKRQKEPQEVTFSKSAQKSLKALDQSDKYSALLKEVKSSQKKESGSIFKFLSPILLLLGGIAGLAFGVQKIPAMKKMFENFQKGAVFTSLKNILNVFNKKNLEFKEFIRGIPFVGRLIDAYDGFSLIAQGQIEKGIKRLAFAIPGAEFIANFFGSSKQRLLGDYDAKTDKSKQFSLFGKKFSFEQVVDGIFNGITNFLNPVIDFFGKVSSLFVQLYEVATKGSNINFTDIIGILNQISVYFPVLSPVTKFLSMLTEKAFVFAADKKLFGQEGPLEVNIGDVFNAVFTEVSEKISMVVSTVVDIFTAISDIFSEDKARATKGALILGKYAPGLVEGIKALRGMLDDISTFENAQGFFGKLGAIKTILTKSNGDQYGVHAALDRAWGKRVEAIDSFTQADKDLTNTIDEYSKSIKFEKDPKAAAAAAGLNGVGSGFTQGAAVGLALSTRSGPAGLATLIPMTAANAVVSGIVGGVTAWLSKGASESLKDLISDRSERVKQLEEGKEVVEKAKNDLRDLAVKEVYKQASLQEKLQPVNDSKAIEQLKTNQNQSMDKVDFKKMVDDIINGLNKHSILLEALLKTQTGNNTSLATIASNTLKSSNVIVNSNSNFNNFSNKAASNYEFQMEDLSKSVYA
jgi:hypothetical protein